MKNIEFTYSDSDSSSSSEDEEVVEDGEAFVRRFNKMEEKKVTERFDQELYDTLSTAEKVLSTDYVPTDIGSRYGTYVELKKVLVDGIRLAKPSGIYLYGPPGTGKTMMFEFVMKQFILDDGIEICHELIDYREFLRENEVDKETKVKRERISVRFLKINCFELIDINKKINLVDLVINSIFENLPNHYKKHPKILKQYFQKTSDYCIILVDELDEFFRTKNGHGEWGEFCSLVYKGNNRVGLFAISNLKPGKVVIDEEIFRHFKKVLFRWYGEKDLTKIVCDRLGKLNLFEDHVLSWCCSTILQKEGGNARSILFLLERIVRKKRVELTYLREKKLEREKDGTEDSSKGLSTEEEKRIRDTGSILSKRRIGDDGNYTKKRRKFLFSLNTIKKEWNKGISGYEGFTDLEKLFFLAIIDTYDNLERKESVISSYIPIKKMKIRFASKKIDYAKLLQPKRFGELKIIESYPFPKIDISQIVHPTVLNRLKKFFIGDAVTREVEFRPFFNT